VVWRIGENVNLADRRIPEGWSAALMGTKVYFFNADKYVRYDRGQDAVDQDPRLSARRGTA